eukprot:scaffold1469_cov119-Cylindrotheca_fusiformis.AAC.30
MSDQRGDEQSSAALDATDCRQPPPMLDVEYLKHEIPSEAQLVLLSLDYLRDLRRAYSNPKDLLEAEGLHSDWLTLGIYALNRAFANPVSLAKQNDAWKKPEGLPYAAPSVDTKKLPSIEAMTREVTYAKCPLETDDDEANRPFEKDLESYAWYDYDDSNPANAHRFYALNGISCGSAGPLLLGEIAAAGLAHMQARSRQAAEQDMIASPLFEQFLETAKAKGFFETGNDIPRDDPMEEQERRLLNKQLYNERYAKAVAKFRSKLAAKAQPEEPEVTLADHLHSRRMRRCLAVRRERANKNNEAVPDPKLVVFSLSKRIESLGPKTPTSSNPEDLNEAERLKALGNAYMQKKDYESAADAYTQALKVSPSGPSSHVYFSNRAAALLSMKRFREAILDSERALALKPTYAKAHARLGLAHYLLGEYRQATEAYAVALRYEPNNTSSKSYLEKATCRLAGDDLQSSSFGPSGESFSMVSVRENSSRGGRNASVPTEERIRDQKEAEKAKTRGNSLMASRDYSKALEEYSIAIKLNRDGPQSHVYFANRSAALCYLERYAEAAKDAEKSLRLRPTYGKAHARLGLARFSMNDFTGAVKAYRAALEFDPNNDAAKAYLTKAQLQLEKQREVPAPVSLSTGKDARKLLNDPDTIRMAKRALSEGSASNLMDDPEMLKIAKKVVSSNPETNEAGMATSIIHQS